MSIPRGAKRASRPAATKLQDVRPAVATSVDAFRRILRALRLAEHGTRVNAGISAAQLYVLQALADGEEASLSEIAGRTMTDRSSVASVVERLVDAGLVSREPSRADRRRAAITITRKGRTLVGRAPEAPTAQLVCGLEALPDAQLIPLARALEDLTRVMGLRDKPAGMLFEDEL